MVSTRIPTLLMKWCVIVSPPHITSSPRRATAVARFHHERYFGSSLPPRSAGSSWRSISGTVWSAGISCGLPGATGAYFPLYAAIPPPISEACSWPCSSLAGYIPPGDGGLPPTSLVSVLPTPCFSVLALFLRRKRKAPTAAATPMAPTATPTPMPAFAPVERPLEAVGVAEVAAVSVPLAVPLVTLDAVGVETETEVAVGRPSVACESQS